MNSLKSETFIIKIAGYCNLDCSYCYYYKKGSHQHLDGIIQLELMDRFLSQVSTSIKRIHLIWHGGEPLLAGNKFFHKLVKIQENIKEMKGLEFKNSLQTNATLITDEWIEIFKLGKFGVGVSLDGPRWLHDLNRRYPSGKGSYDQTMRGIEILQDAGIDFSVLSVLSNTSIGHSEEIFEFFLSKNIRNFDFLPLAEKNGDGLSYESIKQGEYGKYMINVFDLWFARDDPLITIRYIDQLLKSIIGGKVSLCKLNKKCHEFLTIDYNGDVFPCDNYVKYKEVRFGNLHCSNLQEILNSNEAISFRQRLGNRHSECKDCSVYKFCNGGCSRYSYMWDRNFASPNYFCGDIKNLTSHIIDVIRTEHPLLIKRLNINNDSFKEQSYEKAY